MKKILLVVLALVLLVACASCAKKEEAKSELYTITVKNNSGETLYKAGVRNRVNNEAATLDELPDGRQAVLSIRATKDATTGAPNQSVIYTFEDQSTVESVVVAGETASEFVIEPRNK